MDGPNGHCIATVIETDLVLGYSAAAAFGDVANTDYAQPNQRAGYGSAVATRVGQVDQVINCLHQDGIIQ